MRDLHVSSDRRRNMERSAFHATTAFQKGGVVFATYGAPVEMTHREVPADPPKKCVEFEFFVND